MLQYLFQNVDLAGDLLCKNIGKLNNYTMIGGLNLRTGYFAF